MILPPASLPAAASVPISSHPYSAGAAARQASDAPHTNKPLAARPANSKENPARTNTNTQSRGATSASRETESADSSSGESTPEQAFADIIQQMSSQASAPAPQAPAANADAGLFRAWQVAGVGSTVVIPAAPTQGAAAAVPPGPAPTTADKKLPAAANAPRSATGATAAPAKEPAQNIPLVPIDIVTAIAPVKPKLAELDSGGGVAESQLKPQAAHAAASKPEAALTVVIRSGDQMPVAAPAGNETVTTQIQTQSQAQAAENSPNQPEPVASSAAPAAKSDNTATAGTAPLPGTPQVTSDEAVTPVSAASPHTEVESRKSTAGETAATPDIAVARAAGTQTAAFQDLQLKAEPAKTDNAAPRSEAQKAPAAPAEPPAPERGSAQPLKSVALEFTPDGARDVKVRLSERGGEVHVSVHSTDPAVTKNLRAGVTDLASVLQHAGYDAKAWTGARQQPENPRQQEQQAPQRRSNQAGAPAEQFDSILQQPNQENS